MANVEWDCPKCGVIRGRYCRSLTSGKSTDSHRARFTDEAKELTFARLRANERERARAHWLEPSRTR